jgi:hypothetical protein
MARAEANSSQAKEKLPRWRAENPAFARWAEGYGVTWHGSCVFAPNRSSANTPGNKGGNCYLLLALSSSPLLVSG